MSAVEVIPEVNLRLDQVEAQTGMKKSYIYREMGRGTFPPSHKVGGSTRWFLSDVRRWVESHRVAPPWQPPKTE